MSGLIKGTAVLIAASLISIAPAADNSANADADEINPVTESAKTVEYNEGGETAEEADAAEGEVTDENTEAGTDEEDAAAEAGTEESTATVGKEDAAEADADEEGISYEEVILAVKGSGRVFMTDGMPDYEPSRGHELIMITADKDAGEYKAGSDIPEDKIGTIQFSEGTTLTYVFEPIAEETRQPASSETSADAIFEGVWDSDTNSIT